MSDIYGYLPGRLRKFCSFLAKRAPKPHKRAPCSPQKFISDCGAGKFGNSYTKLITTLHYQQTIETKSKLFWKKETKEPPPTAPAAFARPRKLFLVLLKGAWKIQMFNKSRPHIRFEPKVARRIQMFDLLRPNIHISPAPAEPKQMFHRSRPNI